MPVLKMMTPARGGTSAWRGPACPLSTKGGTRLVRLVRGRGGGERDGDGGAGRACASTSARRSVGSRLHGRQDQRRRGRTRRGDGGGEGRGGRGARRSARCAALARCLAARSSSTSCSARACRRSCRAALLPPAAGEARGLPSETDTCAPPAEAPPPPGRAPLGERSGGACAGAAAATAAGPPVRQSPSPSADRAPTRRAVSARRGGGGVSCRPTAPGAQQAALGRHRWRRARTTGCVLQCRARPSAWRCLDGPPRCARPREPARGVLRARTPPRGTRLA